MTETSLPAGTSIVDPVDVSVFDPSGVIVVLAPSGVNSVYWAVPEPSVTKINGLSPCLGTVTTWAFLAPETLADALPSAVSNCTTFCLPFASVTITKAPSPFATGTDTWPFVTGTSCFSTGLLLAGADVAFKTFIAFWISVIVASSLANNVDNCLRALTTLSSVAFANWSTSLAPSACISCNFFVMSAKRFCTSVKFGWSADAVVSACVAKFCKSVTCCVKSPNLFFLSMATWSCKLAGTLIAATASVTCFKASFAVATAFL